MLASLASRPLAAFPVSSAGRLPRYPFRGLLNVHCALSPARSLNRPRRPFSIEVLQSVSLPPRTAPIATGWSDSCRTGSAPAEKQRLSTAHDEISDCDRLRDDSLRALAPGTDDLSRERRLRERNRGHPLAGSRRCWWRCSGTATPRPRTRSSGTLPTTRCTASSGGVSSTAILTVTATCRGTLPAGRTCCPGGCCGGPTWTRRTGR